MPFNKTPMRVDLTKYLYVPRQIMEVITIAIENLISIGICKLNMKNVRRQTMGKCIKYIQYAPSEMNLSLPLYEPNLFSDRPMNAYEYKTAQVILNRYCNNCKSSEMSFLTALVRSSLYMSDTRLLDSATSSVIYKMKPIKPARR